jgi:ketosteroid isomerase-like protein
MSRENVAVAREGYQALNEAYRTGDFLTAIEKACHPDVVLKTSGMFPETGEYHGHEGMREFTANQAEAFEEMSIQPEEFIDAGDKVVVPVRFGGKARHSGIQAEFSVVHVWTLRDGKALRLDMYQNRDEALEAAGMRK